MDYVTGCPETPVFFVVHHVVFIYSVTEGVSTERTKIFFFIFPFYRG